MRRNMQFSVDDLISPDQILADVLLEVDDEDTKTFNHGWYISQIQQALEELSFDTFFNEIYLDFTFPTDLRLKIPKGAFNVKKIFIYTGEDCDVASQTNVYIKQTYFTRGEGKSTMMNRAGISDPFISGYNYSDSIYFASLQNGYIHFGEGCIGHTMVRVYFNGIFTDVGAAPFVPRQFRQVVKTFVAEKFYRNMKSRKPRVFRAIHSDTYNMLYKAYDGEWDKAMQRSKSLDSKFREDMGEYLSKGNW